MKKKLLMTLFMATILGSSMTVSAGFTPMYKPASVKIPEIHVELSDGVKDAVEKAAKDAVDNIDVTFITTTPVITENRFIHSKAFYEKTRLQVRWKEVENATSYEILVTKQDGTEHTYTSTGTSLIVNKGSDDFMTECVMGGTVKVRAVKGDGEAYSMWTKEDTISCNVLFH